MVFIRTSQDQMSYYTNVNGDLIATIPMTAKRVLEIGCGDGSFAMAAKHAIQM